MRFEKNEIQWIEMLQDHDYGLRVVVTHVLRLHDSIEIFE